MRLKTMDTQTIGKMSPLPPNSSRTSLVLIAVALVVIIIAAVAYMLPQTSPQTTVVPSTSIPQGHPQSYGWQSSFVNSSFLDASLTNVTVRPNATFYTMPVGLSFQTFVSDPSRYQNDTCHGTYLMKSATQPIGGINQSDLSALDPHFPYVQSVAVYTRSIVASGSQSNSSDLCAPDYSPLVPSALMGSPHGTLRVGGLTIHTYLIPNMTAGELSGLRYYTDNGTSVYWYLSTVVYGNYEMQFTSIGNYANRNMSSLSAETENLTKAFVSSASGSQ